MEDIFGNWVQWLLLQKKIFADTDIVSDRPRFLWKIAALDCFHAQHSKPNSVKGKKRQIKISKIKNTSDQNISQKFTFQRLPCIHWSHCSAGQGVHFGQNCWLLHKWLSIKTRLLTSNENAQVILKIIAEIGKHICERFPKIIKRSLLADKFGKRRTHLASTFLLGSGCCWMTLRSCWNLNQFRLWASWTIGVVGGSPVLDKVQTKNFSFFLPFRELKLAKTDIFCNLVGWRRFDCLQFCHVWVSVLTEVFFVPDVWLLGLSPSGLPPVQTSLGPGSGWPRRGHKLQLHPPLLHHQSQTPQLSTAVWQSFLEHSSDRCTRLTVPGPLFL